MAIRHYSSTAVAATLTEAVDSSATAFKVSTTDGWPASTPFTLIVDHDLATEEVVEVTSLSGLIATVVRGVDSTSAVAHGFGAVLRHGVSGRDHREANQHVNATQNVHGIGSGNSVVGTDTTQVLKNKTINSADNTVTVAQGDVTGLGTALGAKADKSITVTGSGGISGGGDLSANRVLTIADSAIASGKIANGAIVTDKLATDSVTSVKLVVGSVTTDKIAAAAVTVDKVAPTVGLLPTGAVVPFAGSTAPTGFLLCDGAAVSRSTYATLFAVVGTTFGEGDGSTTFNVPDLRGQTVVGVAGDWSELDAVGKTHGARTHTLSESEMPAHVHSGPSHTHTGTTGSSTVDATVANGVATGTNGSSTNPVARGDDDDYVRVIRSSSHNHSFTTNASGTGNTGSKGGGGAHNNTQPSMALNYILRAA